MSPIPYSDDSGSRLRELDLKQIYPLYQRLVYQLCLRLVGEPSAADDLCHEVFLKVYENRNRFEGKSAVSTWVYRIAFNHCLDHLRRLRRMRVNNERLSHVFGTFNELRVGDADLLMAVTQYKKRIALAGPLEKRILQLFVEDGCNQTEIAALLGISTTTVGRRLDGIAMERPSLRRAQSGCVAEGAEGRSYKVEAPPETRPDVEPEPGELESP